MAPASSRLIFVFLLVINCILWSQSRYGTLSTEHNSLVKRIFSELTDSTVSISEKQVSVRETALQVSKDSH